MIKFRVIKVNITNYKNKEIFSNLNDSLFVINDSSKRIYILTYLEK